MTPHSIDAHQQNGGEFGSGHLIRLEQSACVPMFRPAHGRHQPMSRSGKGGFQFPGCQARIEPSNECR